MIRSKTMLHKRCREIEGLLRDDLTQARERIAQLEEALDSHLRVAPPLKQDKGKIHYMDDARMVELENGS